MPLPSLSIFSRYQALTRFVRDKCDSEQEIESSRVDERWLVDRILDFLNVGNTRQTYQFDTFVPDEFKTGRAGGARRIDIVGYPRRLTKDGSAALLIEVKLMMENNRQWAQEVLSDIFRVACARKQTTHRTHRLVLVAGQERCWRQLDEQCNGLVRRLCPVDRRHNLVTLGLTNKRRWTSFTSRWKATNAAYLEEYLTPHLPAGVSIELAGLSRSHRDVDEEPDRGISARLWRVFPGKSSAGSEPLDPETNSDN